MVEEAEVFFEAAVDPFNGRPLPVQAFKPCGAVGFEVSVDAEQAFLAFMLVGAVGYDRLHVSSQHLAAEGVAGVAPVGYKMLDASGQYSPHSF